MSESEEIVGASRPSGKIKKLRPTPERLHECFTYTPETGIFRWKKRSGSRSRITVGAIAGNVGKRGYWILALDSLHFPAHQAAWAMMTGAWPENQLDHGDRNRLNNRWENLRVATNQQNCCNRSIRCDNKSGFKGVSYNTKKRRWVAQIGAGRGSHIGYFLTPEAASTAYQAAATLIHGEFAHF